MLVIDDQPVMLKSVAVHLKRLDYEVIEAADGYQAVDLAKKHHPDLILSDLNMPRMDGLTIIRLLRLEDEFSFTPIIMFTEDGQKDVRSKAFQLGADDFVCKEHIFEELEHRLERALTFARLRERLAVIEMRHFETDHTAFKGTLNLFGVSCLISMGRMEDITGTLRVETSDRETGLVYFQHGEIKSAKVIGNGVLKNKKAITRMLTWTAGNFEWAETDNSTVPNEMEVSTESLLLEAAATLDEMRLVAG
ncbi:MAG: response regulator [Verrucomicrobiota bacterium]